jgi:hypothetical protein
MTLYRMSMVLLVGAALAACHKVEQGVLTPPPARAALRYVNLVPDTGAVDFRIIDIIGDAPVAGAATYRTGGQPFGVSTNFLPPHFPVQVGTRHIRVFPNSSDPAVTSQILLDTMLTFDENVYYTFYLYGYARTGSTPHIQAVVTTDNPTAGAGVLYRVLHFAPTGVGAADVDVVTQATVAPLTGTATFPNVAVGAQTSYVNVAAGATMKAVVTAPGTRTPFLFSANAPAGVVGTATDNPIAGSNVASTAISVVLVSPSVAGSAAPQTAAYQVPAILFMIDRQPNLTAP